MNDKVNNNYIKPKIARTLLLLLSALSAGFLGGWSGSLARSNSPNLANTSQKQQIILNESQVISQIAQDVGQSVVSVNVTAQGVANDFLGTRRTQQRSAGTGFIVSSEGIIVTNRHVVPQGSTTVSVTLSDGTELPNVEVLGRTNDSDPLDIAFLKVKDKKGKSLKAVKLGDSGAVKVGDKSIAIGNALGQFQNTVTSGIISGFGRSIEAGDGAGSETLQNLFQTDTAINPGNSGGPLVNINGEVIAINTAIAGGSAQNIGFAIPINDVQGLIKGVLSKGKLERPYLGVRYVTLTDDYAYQLNLSTKRGAYIAPSQNSSSVIKDSPADKAGLKEKDIITKIEGVNIDDNHSLTSILGKREVGDEVKLTIVRDGKEQDISIKLEAAPQG